MSTITRVGTTARWSDVVIHNHTLYVVEVPTTLTADIHQQTAEVLTQLTAQLERHGSGTDKILQATIYLKDIRQIGAFNAQWDIWLPSGHAPVRACVEANLADPGYLVEVQLTAAVA
ncbi:MAG: RidA family protein [Aeromonas sp.]